MGELKSQPFFSPYSWDGEGGGQEAGKGLSWRREVGGRTWRENRGINYGKVKALDRRGPQVL